MKHKTKQGTLANGMGWAVPKVKSKAIATALFLGASGASLPLATVVYAQSYSFNSVSVIGNERVDAATILSFAGIKNGEALTAGGLNDAYQRVLRSGLFETVEIVPKGSTLEIKVLEYPFVNVIAFEGNARIKDEELQAMIGSQSRRAYSPSTAQSDAALITELYRTRGRIAATVEPKIIRRDGNRVDLVFEIAEGKVVEIERLSFVGNRAFSDRRLRQVLETKQAGLLRALVQRDSFVAERLELDRQVLTDFYRARGYVDFQITDISVENSRERDATFVTFSVREGLPYTIGKVTTVSEVPGLNAAEFTAVQKIKPGQVWTPSLIDNNIARMENLALKQGANFIRVEPRITRDVRTQTANVEFAIVRGPKVFIERIDIEGNATTLDQVVRRQFRSVEGDPFNPREIRQSAERIRALGFFKDAQVNAEEGSHPDQVIVNVDVEEQPTGSLGFGLSYSVANGVGGTLNFSESNFLGRGQGLAFSLSTTSDNQNTSINFVEPGLFGRDLSFNVGAFYQTSESDYALYNTRNIGFTLGLGFPIQEESRLNLTYRLEQHKLYDFTGTSPIIERETLQGKKGALISSALGYSYEFDNRITGLDPLSGSLLRFGQEISGLGGDTKILTSTAFGMREQKIWNEDVTLRVIVEGGHMHAFGDNGTRVTDRFFGRGKIRGFEPNGIGPRDGLDFEDALGGNAFAAARFEADFPLGLPEEYGLTGGAFLDVGSVWSLADRDGGVWENGVLVQSREVDASFKPRVVIGLALMWDTPIGPLRFNFTKAVKKQDYDREQNFDLTVSTKF